MTATTIFLDPDGYPAITPPGARSTRSISTRATIRWKIPFGEFPELAAKGLKNTGSDNYGGPVVTAERLALHRRHELRQEVPRLRQAHGQGALGDDAAAAGNATPSVYEINGRQYVVIACGGGKNGAPSGSSVVAFALPKREGV